MRHVIIDHEQAQTHGLSLRAAYVLSVFKAWPKQGFNAPEVVEKIPLADEFGTLVLVGLMEGLTQKSLLKKAEGMGGRWMLNTDAVSGPGGFKKRNT